MLNIVIPMAGKGSRFQQAGYAFPKPLIDVKGNAMIEVVVRNLRPDGDSRFVFVAQREHANTYDLHNLLKRATGGNFEMIQIDGVTEGAACTVLTAVQHIDNADELLIANSDQFVDVDINAFLEEARAHDWDGSIMTFKARHPKWSYARTNENGKVLETAEKRLISENATAGVYYFKRGSDFVRAAKSMIQKGARYNGEFYVCPSYNELVLAGKNIHISEIPADKMHGLGTPEDLELFLKDIDAGKVALG